MISFKGELKDFVRTFDGGYILNFSTRLEEIPIEELNSLKIAKNGLKIDVCRYREQRSVNANAYFHLLVNKIAKKLKISDDECKVKMNLEYGTVATSKNGSQVVIKLPSDVDITEFYDYAKWIGEKKEKGLKLSYYVLYKQTHTLDTKEMSRLIDGVVSEAKELGIQTLTPNEIAEMKSLWESYCEKQKK